jgi:hypothetical protein
MKKEELSLLSFNLPFRILHEHIKKLSQVILPSHKDLRIPKIYHGECPWPAAQNEIYMINAYKVCSFFFYVSTFLFFTFLTDT